MNQETQDIKLIDLWNVIVIYHKTIILFTLLALVTSITYGLLVTPIYRAEVLMVASQSEERGSVGFSTLAGQLSGFAGLAALGGANNTETGLAILQSRNFLEQYIQERDLLPTLFAEKWDKQNKIWINNNTPSPGATYQTMKNILDISYSKGTGFIILSIEWSNPQVAAKWANDLVARVNDHIRNQAISEAQKSIYFLEEQLKQTSIAATQTVIYTLIEEQTKNIMLANVRDEYAFKIIDSAAVPEQIFKPNKTEIAVIGSMIGFLFAIIFAFFSNFFRQQKHQS